MKKKLTVKTNDFLVNSSIQIGAQQMPAAWLNWTRIERNVDHIKHTPLISFANKIFDTNFSLLAFIIGRRMDQDLRRFYLRFTQNN